MYGSLLSLPWCAKVELFGYFFFNYHLKKCFVDSCPFCLVVFWVYNSVGFSVLNVQIVCSRFEFRFVSFEFYLKKRFGGRSSISLIFVCLL